MAKMKTKKSVKKRFKKTSNGKLIRHQAKTSHLFANKTTKNKRKSRASKVVKPVDAQRYKEVMGKR